MTVEWAKSSTANPVIPFPEWREVSPGTPIRQGDILASLHEDAEIWRKLLIVITADCDLANEKHAGSLTCVPVLNVEDYLVKFKYGGQSAKLLGQMIAEILRIYRNTAHEHGAREISEERLVEWITETPEGTLTETLGIKGKPAARVEDLAQAARALNDEYPRSVQHAAILLGRCKLALGHGTDLDKLCSQAASNIAGTIKTLPGDALFLNELSEIHHSGYIAYLRRVVELQEEHATTTVARASANATHIRVSQLTSPYVHALSQQFGAVFSAIGLPTEYESARDTVVQRISEGVATE